MIRKSELKKAEDHELIVDLAQTNARICLAVNLNLGLKSLCAHMDALQQEMLSRGLLTERDIYTLNM